MKILLTGATGYIGKRLLPVLINRGNEVVCCIRDKSRFSSPNYMQNNTSIIEVDLCEANSLRKIPNDIDVAYYLVHSMSVSSDYAKIERECAINFREALNNTNVKQVIYLSGIVNKDELSEHLLSRKNVEIELNKGNYPLTTFRAGIIVGSGSASFEIIRDLVEKLPLMITPKWLLTKCQPIAASDVIKILQKAALNHKTFNENFDIGSSDIISYKEMLLGFAEERNLKRKIWTIPVMTPKLSSYWLYFVTSTSYKLASSLVSSMKVEVVCRNSKINKILDIKPISYKEAIKNAFAKIESNSILSSWKDSYSSSGIQLNISDFVNIPKFGCFKEFRIQAINNNHKTINKIWSIGGDNGWYYGNWLWKIRGHMDKLFGGVGLRRGRTNKTDISPGDALDFWRVIYANKKEGRLLLFAEMKLPGEAWLEFKVKNGNLILNATFRPLGILGRLYWYSVAPFHGFIFKGLLKELTK